MRIAVDVMGSDYGHTEMIKGAIKWLNDTGGAEVILVGPPSIIMEELKMYEYNKAQVKIVEATEVIANDESPALALRRKRDASIVVATKLVKEGQADAVVSSGSTGAQMAAAIFILGRLEGIERPPIVTAIPTSGDAYSLLIDVGANIDCKPKQLLQFALLGNLYSEKVIGINDPKIALLNNGQEPTKGNNLTVEAYNLLKEQKSLNFIGNIEGRDLFNQTADVIVCDGFIGNIVLKTVEGLAGFIIENLLKETPSLPSFFKKLDYTQVGGAPLLGVKGISIVCHGSSRSEAIYNGINVAKSCFDNDIVALQEEELLDL